MNSAYPDDVVVMGAAHGQRYGRVAGALAEVRVIAARMEDPVVPADVLEAYVQLVSAAFLHFGQTVGLAFGPVTLGQRCRLYDQERLQLRLQRDGRRVAIDRARAAGYLDRVVQTLLLDPLVNGETDVRLYPALCWTTRSHFIL